MDFNFSYEQEMFRKTIATFVAKELAPLASEIDEKEEFPMPVFRRVAELGYLGIKYPEEYGGLGGDNVMYCIFLEEMARGCHSALGGIAIQTSLATWPIFAFGTEEQKQKWLVPAIRGEKIGAFGLTEPNAGSDVASIETTARKEDSRYVLNGTKTFITNGPVADYVITAAKTDKSKGIKGISLFIVERGTPGFAVSRQLKKMCTHAAVAAELSFDECTVPRENFLGEEGMGYLNLREALVVGRIMTAVTSLGLGRAALEDSLKYAQERVQFGQPISKFQAIQFKLAEMATELEAARLMVYHAAWMADQGMECSKEASMAKLFTTEAAFRIACEAMEIYGGYGFMTEYPVQRYFRDSRFLLVGEGTSEIQKLIIAKRLGL